MNVPKRGTWTKNDDGSWIVKTRSRSIRVGDWINVFRVDGTSTTRRVTRIVKDYGPGDVLLVEIES